MSLLRTTARSLTFRPSTCAAIRFNSSLNSSGVKDDQENRDRDLAPRRAPQGQDVQGASAKVAMDEKSSQKPSDSSMPTNTGSTSANSHAGKDKAIGMQDERGKKGE